MHLAAILLLSVAATAGVKIQGPDRVDAGDLAILTASHGQCLSVQQLSDDRPAEAAPIPQPLKDCRHLWLLDSPKQFRVQYGAPDPQIDFSTLAEGTYTFTFVWEEKGNPLLQHTKHVLVVGRASPAPGPPGPTPAPSPSRFGIREQARLWAQEVPSQDKPALVAFAAKCRETAATVLEKKQVRTPQELLNEMVAAANALGPSFTSFRDKLKAASQKLIAENRFNTSADVAAFLLELADGLQ